MAVQLMGQIRGVFIETIVIGGTSRPFATQTAEPFEGGAGFDKCVGRGIFAGLPAFDEGADVALEYLGQVVVAIKLVFIGNAGKTLDGLGDGHDGSLF